MRLRNKDGRTREAVGIGHRSTSLPRYQNARSQMRRRKRRGGIQTVSSSVSSPQLPIVHGRRVPARARNDARQRGSIGSIPRPITDLPVIRRCVSTKIIPRSREIAKRRGSRATTTRNVGRRPLGDGYAPRFGLTLVFELLLRAWSVIEVDGKRQLGRPNSLPVKNASADGKLGTERFLQGGFCNAVDCSQLSQPSLHASEYFPSR